MTDPTQPIIATDATLKTLYDQDQPILIYLHDGENKHKSTTDAVRKLSKKYAGKLQVASVDVTSNPKTAAKYTALTLPAVVTLEQQSFGVREKSQQGEVRPSDVRAHAAYVLGKGDDPVEIAERKARKQQKTAGVVSGGTVDANQRTFRKLVLKSKQPVLVDFWAPWCGPCQQVSPMLEQLGQEYKGKVRVVKVNVDDNPKLSRQYDVMSIPAIMLFENGTIVDRTVGAQPRRVVEKMIKGVLNG
jgi:thioredoxin 1